MQINIGSMNFGGNSSDKEIDGDSTSPINTSSGDVEITGSNNSSINSSSGDIEIGGDNNGNINTSSGDIEIDGKNNGGINTSSGDVKISGDSISSIFTSSGDINIKGSNSGDIETNSGDIKMNENNGNIITKSGDIKTQYNLGNISTLSGKINIGKIKIRIKRNGCNISIGGTMSGMFNSVNTIISGNSNICVSGDNISIVNGEVWVDGVKQDGSNESKNNEYKVYVDDIVIDFEEKQAIKDGKTINITSEENEPIKLLGNDIIVNYQGQLIRIKQDGVNVLGNK